IWEPDALGIISADYKTGEYWLYVPFGARRLTIKHEKLGILRDYMYPIPIEKAGVYIMELTTGKVTTTVEPEQIVSQWLVINSVPSGTDIYIDDKPANQTPYQNELPIGKHTYSLSRDLYLPMAGVVNLTADKKETLNITMKPDFGTLKITTSPEQGAAVSIDGQPTGKVTPCTLEQVKSGEHTLTFRLNMYQTTTQKVTMQAGGNLNLPVVLAPTFAGVTVTTNPASDIYIAGERKGNGTWEGRLLPGVYNFEAKKEKYTSASEKREVVSGQPLTVTLQPIAKTGTLKVMTTPTDAIITLAGENKGTAPATLRNLLVGDYTLVLSLPGYATISKTVTIVEGETAQVTETLVDMSNPASSALAKTNIANEETTGKASFNVQSFTETINGVEIEMVAIKGGTFQMGSNEDGEKPIHTVTVSDFSIGKTEVTVAQFKAFVDVTSYRTDADKSGGSDIWTGKEFKFTVGVNWQCDASGKIRNSSEYDHPVIHVSWNDAVAFCEWLKQKTGKTYRLPTEAEWEFAARGGNYSRGFTYSGSNTIDDVAEYGGNNNKSTKPVAGRKPNELGLYDMSGNVWEWCSDCYGADYYANSPQNNPKGSSTGSNRVYRGGGWRGDAQYCRVAFRSGDTPGYCYLHLGFRPVLVP
ncbi:MAG: formylglycine-generating enzyme family protein, partial [Mariniphaga sp.]